MTLKIYNSLIKKKVNFKPLQDERVGMYVCGVTVYDECHIGHARGAFIFDVIREYLKYKGYKVTYIRNITDVDDKIINKARELVKDYKKEGKDLNLNEAVKEVTEKYIAKYYQDMKTLGIEEANFEPKATEHIQDMIEMIKALLERGFAYEKEGDVYFDIKKFKDYGKLSNQTLEQLRAGTRKEIEKGKKDPLDFALWKKAKEDEPSWQSPFSDGRPGWHIECSAMSIKYLNENFDIHGGGRDLIFPHHENEIAQVESYTGKPFANYWIHNGLLTIEGQKMAKSLGNFISISEIVKKYHPGVLKIFFLSSHYASPIDFSFQKMEEAKASRERFYILFNKIDQIIKDIQKEDESKNISEKLAIVKRLEKYLESIEKIRRDFTEAMDDDFNTPVALSYLFELVNVTNKFIADESIPALRKIMILKFAKLTLLELGRILGIFQRDKKREEDKEMELLNKVMEIIIQIRQKVREDKKFELADSIRRQLDDVGIILEDQKDKTIWRKK